MSTILCCCVSLTHTALPARKVIFPELPTSSLYSTKLWGNSPAPCLDQFLSEKNRKRLLIEEIPVMFFRRVLERTRLRTKA